MKSQESHSIQSQILSLLRTVRSIDVLSLYCALGQSADSCVATANELSALIRDGRVRLEMQEHILKGGGKTLIAMVTLNGAQES